MAIIAWRWNSARQLMPDKRLQASSGRECRPRQPTQQHILLMRPPRGVDQLFPYLIRPVHHGLKPLPVPENHVPPAPACTPFSFSVVIV